MLRHLRRIRTIRRLARAVRARSGVMRDRRRYPRHESWFPVQIDRWFHRGLMGCCIDGSASGLLVRSPVMPSPGERLKLTFKVVPTQSEWIRTEAEVIRATRNEASDDPWPVTIALRFAEPILKLEMQFQIADDRRLHGDPRQRRRHSGIRKITRVVTEDGNVELAIA